MARTSLLGAVVSTCAFLSAGGAAGTAWAQRAGENAVGQATDAFGASIGNESIGLYSETEVRGFSPIAAGNTRLDGLYFDRQGSVTGRLISGSVVRVGLTAQAYPFSAPTGVVDYVLRPAGPRPVHSIVVIAGPNDARQADLDIQQPLGDRLSLAAGVSYRQDELVRGDSVKYLSRGLILQWRPADATRIRAFWGRFDISEDHATPFIVPGAAIPPRFERRYFGQAWATAEAASQLYGVTGEVGLPGGWALKGGLFESDFIDEENYTDLYGNAQADGAASHTFIATPNQSARSTSGELRLTRSFQSLGARHGLQLLFRGRRISGAYGGAAVVALGPTRVGLIEAIERPAFAFRPVSHQRTEQETVGLAYVGDWRNLNVTLSLQRSRYEKRITDPSGFVGVASDEPWLPGATAAYQFHPKGLVYAGYTRGLEDSGVIPENARNFPGALPALRTSQRDAGLRWRLNKDLNLVVGVFDIRKPYFNLDTDNRFVPLGRVSDRGVEVSLTGRLDPTLTLVAGAVFSQPRVDATDAAGVIGKRPVAIASRTVRASVQKMLPDGKTSLDADLTYVGARPVNAANTLSVGDYATLDLGVRYRFRIGSAPATLRLRLLNATNTFAWKAYAGGAIQPVEPRRASITLAADF